MTSICIFQFHYTEILEKLFSVQSFFSMYCVGRSITKGNFEHEKVCCAGKRKQPVEFVLVV